MSMEQLSLFSSMEAAEEPEAPAAANAPDTTPPDLDARSSFDAAFEPFERHMRQKQYSQHTINSFLGDLRILGRYLKTNPALGDISTRDLKDFMDYLAHRRGKPCSPKSYARRLTTLKVFFLWLNEAQVIPSDPAASIIHEPVSTPLPVILFPEEVDRLVDAGRRLRASDQPDVRPLLLFQILLATGIKKAECMAIKMGDLDLSDDSAGVVHIRYDDRRRKHKERKLNLGSGFAGLLREYRAQYHPQVYLFECTNRNLEYVLRDLGLLAGVQKPISFETMRMTCAVRDYKRGMDSETLRLKLGLSRISWEETSKKIAQLAADPL